MLKRVQHDERWQKALARFRRADAALAAAAHTPDEALYDRLGARHDAALARLLRLPAPSLAALSLKLDLLVAHQVWEHSFAEPALSALRRDAHRLGSCSF